MSKEFIPWFKFYPDKFMHGVRGMTAQEVGVYQMILCRLYEENGPVELHMLRLSTYCGMRQNTFKKTIEKLIDLGKITFNNGFISNDRADIEISNRANDLKISSRGGKVSAEKRQRKQQAASSEGQAQGNHLDEDKEEKELTKVSTKKRGSRLSDDWVLPNEWGQWVVGNYPSVSADDVRDEAVIFANYWQSKAGAQATKVDWFKTFQNWFIKWGKEQSTKTKSKQRRSPLTEYANAVDRQQQEQPPILQVDHEQS